MKTIYVGTYQIGDESVRLMLSHCDGGYIITTPGKIVEITVGGDQENWWQVVDILLHEVLEMAFYRQGLRYRPSPDFGNDNGNHLFVMSHTDFSEATARAAQFITPALPDLARAWKKWKR